MSYVGKILVIIQVVMSVLFMAFAGAVFQMHQNWKSKHTAVVTQLNSRTQELTTAQEELAKAKTDLTARLDAMTQEKTKFEAQAKGYEADLGAQVVRINLLEQQRDTQTGLAQAKANEAEYRQREAEQQRIENKKVQDRLDAASAENRRLTDELFAKSLEFDALVQRYNEVLTKAAYLERVVALHKLPTDPREVERQQSPPPPVNGLVLSVKTNKTNRVQFVQLSIGSDDGLIVGHLLDVVRVSPDGQGKPAWLGQVQIKQIEPDFAVAEVVLESKNGIIQEGDNVTTKL